MRPEQFNKIQEKFSIFNSKQKKIADDLVLNTRDYIFSLKNDNIFIKEVRTGREFDFVEYVKSLCGCE